MKQLVIDASVALEALLEAKHAAWAKRLLITAHELLVPAHFFVEATHKLRRLALRQEISWELAGVAHGELHELPVTSYPYAPFRDRVWALRQNVTAYDAWYIGLAEMCDAPLATTDDRLARATGPVCRFLVPWSVGPA